MPDDISDGISTTGRVTVGNSLTGEIETTTDSDAYAVELVAGRTYRIDLEGAATGKGTLADPFLHWLRDSSGNGLHGTRDNDGGEGLNPRQVFTPQWSGTYYITASGQGDSVGTYTLRVTDTSAPVFGASAYGFELAENTGGGAARVSLGTVSATDPEGVSVGYGIVGGNESGSFEIDAASGELFYVGAGEDYESDATSYDLTVRASDGQLTADTTVTVNVTDVAEAPAFGREDYTFELAENADGSAARVSLGAVSATDPEGAPVGYGIVGGNESGSFEIDAASGELFYVGTGEDYEAGAAQFDLTVRASDGALSADAAVSVAVTDAPEQTIAAPADPEILQSVSEPYGEDLPTNTSTIGRVAVGGAATGNIGRSGDRDGFAVELVAGRTYIIDLRGRETDDGTLSDPYLRGIKGPDGRRIAGVSDDDGGEGYNSRLSFTPTETGAYYIVAGAYYTRQGTYELEVRDVSPHAATQEGENGLPAFGQTSYAFELAENAGGDTIPLSLGSVTATDPENSTITYSIESGDPGGLFAIDEATGALSYRGAGEDYESGTTSYDLTVRASDGAGHNDVTVTVNVTDVAEAPAFGQDSYEFDLAENADGATIPLSLGRVTATDPENSPITYSIESGDPGGLFAIDEATGALSYRGAGEDYESETKSYELRVRASDGGLHTDVTVNVNVTDVADVEEYVSLQQEADGAPVFSQPSYAFELAENADGVLFGIAVAPVVATDPDNDRITYSIEAGDPDGLFMIDAGTGLVVYLGAGEDYESGTTSYELTVRASDGGLHSDVTVTVNVTDVEEYDSLQQEASVSEPDGEDLPANVSTSGAVAVGGSARGEIASSGDRDWFAVTLEAGKTYRFYLEGSRTGGGTLRDPYLYGIHDANGVFIAGTMNGDPGFHYLVYFTTEEAGAYYVVAGANGMKDGTYTLSVAEVVDDFEAGTGTSGAVTVGGSESGEIERGYDHDWFAVTLEAGRTYRIDLENSQSGGIIPMNPYLYGVHDADGALIAGTTDDNGGSGTNSRVYFTAEEAGAYYVAAGAWGNFEGAYTLTVTDVDDFVARTWTTGEVAVGGLATGEIEFDGDRDWFAVTLEAGRIYRIDLEGSWTGAGAVANPYLRGIHDADGVLIAGTTDDNGGSGTNSRVTFTATEDATYYVAAGAWGTYEGAYTLSVTDVTDTLTDDFAAETGTSGEVAVGGSARGEIEFDGDRDWFAVTLEAGRSYRIDLKGEWTGNSTLRDPYLQGVHHADGVLIAGTTDNDGGWGTNSRVYFTAEDAGTYYVAAGAWGNFEGTYTLSVREVPDDFVAATVTSGMVAVGGSARGEIEFDGDRDWFAVEFEAGRSYRIDLEGSWTGAGTLVNTYLRGIHDTDGVLIAGTTNDNGGIGTNSRVNLTAEEAGAYYVVAGGWGYFEGTYTLSVEEVL